MMKDINTVKKFCYVSKEEEKILNSSEKPIVLLKKKYSTQDTVAPNNNSLGVMIPYTPLHCLLFQSIDLLVMTSGNKQDEPICKTNDEAIKELSGICDYFLIHNRDIYNRCDDSIVKVQNKNDLVIIRRSRGYVPNPIGLTRSVNAKQSKTSILAAGAELKNTFCLTRGNEAYVSQFIGDLKDSKTYEFYKESIENMESILKVKPKAIAYDLHPDYLSTKCANELRTTHSKLFTIPTQHHHAHIASVCAENNIDDKVIGVSFDGTGYGMDGNIWGGEFLIVNGGTFERKYHLRYIKLPGGDSAVHEIWRIGFSYLYSIFGDKAVKFYPDKNVSVIKNIINKNINCPLTSSVGRLFDAVASIINLRQEITFDAQAAIELEFLASSKSKNKNCYEYEISGEEINLKKMIIGIVDDFNKHKSNSEISLKFHNTLAEIILNICQKLRKETKINKVALSGGVFQNEILLEKSVKLLENDNFYVFFNKQVPTNDGGISLGQAWIANKIMNSIKIA